MKNLLICTIMRNARPHLERYNAQLDGLRKALKGQYNVHVSIYENDSTDGTAEWLRQARDAGQLHGLVFPNDQPQSTITTEVLGTQHYPSVWNVDRLRNLAAARQKCLDQAGDLGKFSKIAYIEVDCMWSPDWCSELVLAAHPRAAGLGDPDIYSGWSLRSENHPKESVFLYDTCATRATEHHTCWDAGEGNNTWRGATVIETDLGGYNAMCLHPVWSTFNCFCVYNAKPFVEGVKWGYVNSRLDTGQERLEGGTLDADTVVVCEDFRARGYYKVLLNTNCLIRHA